MLSTRPPQHTVNHLHQLEGWMRIGRLSSQRPSGARLRFLPGAFKDVTGTVPLQMDHRAIVGAACSLRESGGFLRIAFQLDDRDTYQARLLREIKSNPDRWGFSPAFDGQSLERTIDGQQIADVYRVSRIREISLTEKPAISSHLFLKG